MIRPFGWVNAVPRRGAVVQWLARPLVTPAAKNFLIRLKHKLQMCHTWWNKNGDSISLNLFMQTA